MVHLVFVHLGPGKANHLPVNIKHIQRLFPDSPITLIVTEDGHRSLLNIPGIEYYVYRRGTNSEKSLNQLKHNSNFREGFWIYSLERIFALEEWSALHPSDNFLHIESDVLLMADFPVSKIDELEVLAWTRFNEVRDVATFLYSPNHAEIAWVVGEIKQLITLDSSLTDMTSLSSISHQHPSRVKILPATPDELNDDENGIFDPAAYGMWLTGQDPRNKWGFLHKFVSLSDSMSKPENFSYQVKQEGRIEIVSKGQKYSLYNLHIHSKKKSLFGINWIFVLRWDTYLSHRRILPVTFSPLAFLSILIDALKKHHGVSGLVKASWRLVYSSVGRK